MKRQVVSLSIAALLTVMAAMGSPQGSEKKTQEKGKTGTGVTMPKPPPPPKPAWKEFKLNPKTTMFLDFTDSNPDMIISIFSRTSGITILKSPEFKTPLTVTSAKAVGLDEAFEIFNTVLGLNGYELKKQGNLMMVAKKQPPMVQGGPPPPPPPQPVIKTYPLKNASAREVARVINDIFSQGPPQPAGGQPQPGMPFIISGPQPQPGGPPGGTPGAKNQVKAAAEEYSNSVIVTALPNDHTNVEKLIQDLDKPSTSPLESELFQLKYVPAEQALTAIQDVLIANNPTGRGSGRQQNNRSPFDFGFFGFGGFNQRNQTGGQTATAINQTNSILVNATRENLDLIKKLVEHMDKPGSFVGTTFVIKLENAKAADVADLLTKSFAERPTNNNAFPFFFFSDFGSNRSQEKPNLDIDEHGQVVNVRDIVGKVTINADPNTNSLIIVTQPSNMKMIREVIDRLDAVAEQVMIETIIVEANLDKTTKLGVEWNFSNNGLFKDPSISGSGSQGFGLQNASPPLEGFKYTLTANDYKIFLHALQTDSRFKVLDTPKIFTSNNVKAVINVSQKLPYITSQQTGIGGNLLTTYTFQDVGVILTVTPRITASGDVIMEVDQSADDLQGFTDFDAPIINHRQATTTVTVADGETIVLGGIIRHISNDTVKKIPILGDIPFIGNLFKSTSRTNGQVELMVFLTPRIVRSNREAQKVRLDETGKLSKESQNSLRRVLPPVDPDKYKIPATYSGKK